MPAISLNGTTVYYRFAGQAIGGTLVFANSLGTDWRVWEPVAERLGKRYRLLYYDKRGHGMSSAEPPPSGMSDYVDDLAALLNQLKVARAVVCGLSVGGMIALGLAVAHPQLVRALVLCDTGHRIGTAERWNGRIETIRQDGLQAIADGVLELWFTPAFRSRRAAEAEIWRNMLTRTPVEGYASTCAAIRDADLTRAAAAVTVPTLCLCGGEDLATPPELVRELSGLIPGSVYREIPDAAHMPTVENPDAVSGFIEEFIEERNLA